MLQAGWIGNLVLRLPRITMMEGIWAAVCQAYEILSIHPGCCQAFPTTVMFSICVWRAELKPTNPLFIVCLCVYAHVCVCVETNKWITWIGFSRCACCSGVNGGLCLVYDYEFKSRRWQNKRACENTKVGCFVCDCLEMQLFNGAAVVVSMLEASESQK